MVQGEAGPSSGPARLEPSTIPEAAHQLSKEDLVDYRAAQRTFDGAYTRTALGQLCYAVVILRLFQSSYFYVGLAYCVLAMGFVPIAVYRYRNAIENDDLRIPVHPVSANNAQSPTPILQPCSVPLPPGQGEGEGSATNHKQVDPPSPVSAASSLGRRHRVIFKKGFVTAGAVVAVTTAFVFVLEVTLLALVFLV